jgi:hypothetical protein
LDLDFKDEKISTLNKELEDLHTGGASEEEVATLKRQKHELEMRLKEEASYSTLKSCFFLSLLNNNEDVPITLNLVTKV